ncbi:MAG TPA: DOMON-like domain-containing protein [Allosphingosinicella sp.]
MFETYRLIPHPDYSPDKLIGLEVDIDVDANEITVDFRAEPRDTVLMPASRGGGRQDGLWETTCFELFIRPNSGEAYFEFNFAPTAEWAAYRFSGYRQGMEPLPTPLGFYIGAYPWAEVDLVSVDLDFGFLPDGGARLGVCAVIDEVSGCRSYWALAHGPGEPDFHNEACFALEVPAANAP